MIYELMICELISDLICEPIYELIPEGLQTQPKKEGRNFFHSIFSRKPNPVLQLYQLLLMAVAGIHFSVTAYTTANNFKLHFNRELISFAGTGRANDPGI